MSDNPEGTWPANDDRTRPSDRPDDTRPGRAGSWSGRNDPPPAPPYSHDGRPGQQGPYGAGTGGHHSPYGMDSRNGYGGQSPYGGQGGHGSPYGGGHQSPYGASPYQNPSAPYYQQGGYAPGPYDPYGPPGAYNPYGPPGLPGPRPGSDDTTMAMISHLLGLLTGFIGPLVIYMIKKDQSPYVREQAAEALNFQLTLFIAYFVAMVLAFVFIGFLLFPVIWIGSLIFMIMAAVATNRGERYRYPMNIRFVS
ncbi:DUF4870 domain-containing protein [Planobispora takensis]|uniref:DUF4870 domain-containing protein n=1 Tax=Planobispora takensis TaxID=1367882 RepID=A0A8J3STB2_9ACTN|nr:DUF4870 domain-containing protein [Planobispora takensis]GIH98556.1 hypothetical protein Pta02_05650 [Planobispora takensis]